MMLGDSVDPDVELCIEDLLDILLDDWPFDDCSFLLFRWPTVSLVVSTQDTSNIVAGLEEVRSAV